MFGERRLEDRLQSARVAEPMCHQIPTIFGSFLKFQKQKATSCPLLDMHVYRQASAPNPLFGRTSVRTPAKYGSIVPARRRPRQPLAVGRPDGCFVLFGVRRVP